MSFWDIIWFILITYLFVAYLVVFFGVVADLFRDKELGGFAKALWFVALIFAPVLSLLVYVIARGRGMAERQVDQAIAAQRRQEAYIQSVAGSSPTPTAQIAEAKQLLDTGAISATEFDTIKANALASSGSGVPLSRTTTTA